MRSFLRVCSEVDIASMPAKMRRMARARLDRVNSEYQRATRVVERLLQAHGGRQEERRPPAGGGYREEQKHWDDFCTGRAPNPRMECEDSIPMERRPTLPVNEILASESQERSWESAAMPGRWGHPSAADRGRVVGDLDMAGLNIGAPPERGQSASASWCQHTAGRGLRGAAPHVLRLFGKGGLSAAARAEHPGQRRGRSLPTRDELPGEGSRWLLKSSTSRCRGEQGISACAAAGRVRICDSVRGRL
jgi:hypothetical protein